MYLSQDSLRQLADETGGYAAVNSNNVGTALDRIVRANSRYYVLGYYPADTPRDGRFHKIEVRAKRPGLRVSARKGYVSPRPPDAGRPVETGARTRARPRTVRYGADVSRAARDPHPAAAAKRADACRTRGTVQGRLPRGVGRTCRRGRCQPPAISSSRTRFSPTGWSCPCLRSTSGAGPTAGISISSICSLRPETYERVRGSDRPHESAYRAASGAIPAEGRRARKRRGRNGIGVPRSRRCPTTARTDSP